MRTIIAPDEMAELDDWLEQRRQRGADLYDYEVSGVLRLSPAPRHRHSQWQARLIVALAPMLAARDVRIGGPANLGRDGDYVVPDVVATTIGQDSDVVWLTSAALAIEVLSPRENEIAKVKDYQAVVAASGMQLGELWYVDPVVAALRIYDPTRQWALTEHSRLLDRSVSELELQLFEVQDTA